MDRVVRNLPHDIIVEILSRLPIKSLARFKCVSKPWRSLILNPLFAKLQFERAQEKTHKILLSRYDHIESLDYEASINTFVKLRCPFERPDSPLRILGSGNGLVCVALDDCENFFIWNPFTGEYKKLPDPTINKSSFVCSYGFGYDSSSDDYKVFVFAYYKDEIFSEVFSVKANSWRSIQVQDQFCPSFPEFSYAYLLNGAFHYSFGNRIYAFDLGKEEFWVMPMPDENTELSDVAVIGGQLYLVSYNLRSWNMDLWVMKEYGVKASWTKANIGNFGCIYYYLPLVLLCFTKKSDEFIAITGAEERELLLFNLREKTKKLLTSDCEPIVYVESLISPNAQDEMEMSF